MSGEELRAAAQELVDDIDAGRMFMNKVLRVRAALAAPSTPEPTYDPVGRICVSCEEGDHSDCGSNLCGCRMYGHNPPAAPSTPEPSGLRAHIAGPDCARFTLHYHQPDGNITWPPCPTCGAAPSTEPALDAERLATIHRPVTNPMYPRPICEDDGQEWPCKTAIVARLAEPQPSEETR